MLNLPGSDLFMEQMAAEHPTLVQNIENSIQNIDLLNCYYHYPNKFILHLNNALRSLIFFIENSIKNAPEWLHNSIIYFTKINEDDCLKLTRLRNLSAHQKLVCPDESIIWGLYRIRSSEEYKFKLGLGDPNVPVKHSIGFAMQKTEEIFHDLLTLPSILFMDLEHSALGECLGITRKWLYRVKFHSGDKKFDEVIDVYSVCVKFTFALLNSVCQAYALHKDIKYGFQFVDEAAEYNNINTLLEIDLYPSLFSKWWDDKCDPLNYGICRAIQEGELIKWNDDIHNKLIENLTPDKNSYRDKLLSILKTDTDSMFNEKNIQDFYTFIVINHWHFKRAFTGDPLKNPIGPGDVMKLQVLGKRLFGEYHKKKLCTIASARESLNGHIESMLSKLSANA